MQHGQRQKKNRRLWSHEWGLTVSHETCGFLSIAKLRAPYPVAPSHIGCGNICLSLHDTLFHVPCRIGFCVNHVNMAFYQTNLGILVVLNGFLFYRQRRSSKPTQNLNVYLQEEDEDEEPKDFVVEVDTRVADFVKQYLAGHLLAFAADRLQVSRFYSWPGAPVYRGSFPLLLSF